jgi:tetratricopeptide (TPR) repeat protein
MVWEDVHWSDPTTREVLDLLIDRVLTLRVLLILTFRPEFTPPWIGRPHVTMLMLNRLPRRQRAEMIAHVTGGKALPKDIAEQIIDRTDGVPLFIEELTKSVVESGLVAKSGNDYALTGPVAPLAIPTTLHASLLARLDRLAPTREVAQIGASLGRSFSHELISAVAQVPQHQVDDALVQLVHAELIFRRGTPPDAEYTFKHALVQDAAYSTLLRSRRQQIHARIAGALERQFPHVVTAQPALMAQHCIEAGLYDEAICYWLTAGQQAVGRSAMAEAEAQLRRGLDVLSKLPDNASRWQRELDLLAAIGPALIALKGYAAPEVGKTFGCARALAEKLDQADRLVPLLYGQWLHRVARGEHRLGLVQADQFKKTSEVRSDSPGLLLASFAVGASHFMLGEFVEARSSFEQCHGINNPAYGDLYSALGNPHILAPASAALNLIYLGYIEQGRSRMNESLAAARQLGHVYSVAEVLVWSCWGEWVAGAAEEACNHAIEAVALSDEHGFPQYLGWGLIHRGWSLSALGQTEEGLAFLEKGLAVVRSAGTVGSEPWALILMAEANRNLGRYAEGLSWIAEATELSGRTEEAYSEAELHRVRADLLGANGDSAGAERSYRQALAIAKHQNAQPNCAPPPASLASGATKASVSKPVISLHLFTAGSPKASTRQSCKMLRRCSTSWSDAMHSVTENVRKSDVDVRLVRSPIDWTSVGASHHLYAPSFCFDNHDRMSTMLRSAVTLLACLAISSANAAELTCKQWFEYGHRSHLPHGKSERMAEIRAAVNATFDTIEVMRAGLAKRSGQTGPSPHTVIEIQDAVISACQREQDRQVRDVVAAVREATVDFELATYPVATKP